ncbi:hypothetical protein EV193_102639 [Herbihabitans rhizosphaerae]|uniref:Uncharacterized protein n=1 Tax=Herbihabitans rhizosphaerae TaxID=1872711 RepID=A0A4Q7L281_9PSEU|nr:hypothetical protein [Herbihabitans rhizosphaerae]RZS43658.1 hypothetical protein EV193_102639 [Herbihabitans rhizosphaerae]
MSTILRAFAAGVLVLLTIVGCSSEEPEPTVAGAALLVFEPDVSPRVPPRVLDDPAKVTGYSDAYRAELGERVGAALRPRATDGSLANTVYVAFPISTHCYRATGATLHLRNGELTARKIGQDTPTNMNCARGYLALAVFQVPRAVLPADVKLPR